VLSVRSMTLEPSFPPGQPDDNEVARPRSRPPWTCRTARISLTGMAYVEIAPELMPKS
jgi:hypothetical protein